MPPMPLDRYCWSRWPHQFCLGPGIASSTERRDRTAPGSRVAPGRTTPLASSEHPPWRTLPQPPRTFADLGVPAPLVAVLADAGITAPFPIQAATLPDSLAGRDVLGRGRTGSGKTYAFVLPLLARLAAGRGKRQPGPPPRPGARPDP